MQSTQSLTQKSRHAFHWYYSGAVARIFLSFGTNVLLARLLGPIAFGQMAFILVVLSIGNLFANAGVPSALIQTLRLDSQDVRFAFTIQMLIGSGIGLLIWCAAPGIASLFLQPGLVPLLRASAPVFLLQAFGSTSAALLQRQHAARPIQTSFILSYLVGYLAVGVPLAKSGFGVWTLITAQLIQAGLNSLLLYSNVRHSVLPSSGARSKGLLSFGAQVLAGNLCSWGILNLDNALVGRFAGSFQLGLYSRAFSLAQTPAETVTSSMQQVLLPTVSQSDEGRVRLSHIHAAMFGLVLLVLGPACASMAAVPEIVIRGLYGHRWVLAAPFFRPLALAIPVHAAMAISGPMLLARGRPHLDMLCQSVALLLAVGSYAWALQHSVLLLSWTVLAVYILRCLIVSGVMMHVSGGAWKDLAAVTWPALLVSAIAAGAAALIGSALSPSWPVLRLICVIFGTGTTLAALWIFSGSLLLLPILRMLPQIASIVPAWLWRCTISPPTLP